MSITSHIFWPSQNANLATIAPLQSVGANLTVQIQSNQPNMPNVPVNNSGVYFYDSMIRKVSLTSTADLSAINFSITGLSTTIDGNGNPTATLAVFTEVLGGPNADTVQSARIYSRIDSITTGAPIAAPNQVSVGFGNQGITAYVFLNLNVGGSLQGWAIQGQPINAQSGFVWNCYGSLTAPETPNTLYGNLTPFPQPIPAFLILGPTNNTNAYTASINGLNLWRIIWTNVNDSAGDGNASLYVDIIQQGLAR